MQADGRFCAWDRALDRVAASPDDRVCADLGFNDASQLVADLLAREKR
jgi:hypothetical protein